jgi:multiple sugar transport system permease protein
MALAEPVEAAPPGPTASTDAAGLGRARAWLFVAPGLVLVAIFLVFPALWTIYLGTTNYELTGERSVSPDYVGIDNYTDTIADPDFRDSLGKTLLFVFGSALVGQMCLGFAIAWMLRTAGVWVRRTVETVVLMAWILPGSVVGFLWYAFLSEDDGTLNAILPGGDSAWLVDHPMWSIVVFNTWRGTAFSMLLFTAALATVPPSQLETARLSGANGWQQLRDVVLPNIRGHILTTALLISLWTFNDFTPFLITGGVGSEILPIYIYKTALTGQQQLGLASAVSLIVLLINLVVALTYLAMLRRRRAR